MQAADNTARRREGFVATPPIEPPDRPLAPSPSQTTPQPVLPAQLVNEPPVLEAPLSEAEQARKDLAANPEVWPVTVDLIYKTVMTAEGRSLNKLTFREPRAVDINRVGNPTRMLWDGEIVIEERKMTHIMSALCGVPVPFLEQMDTRDWNSCALRLRKFFLPDLRGW